MQYMLMIYADPAGFARLKPEEVERAMGGYFAYNDALKAAKVYVAGERLKSTSTASTVKVTEGKTKVQDGPFAESKEELGGYYIIDVPDLDAALKWAAKCPGANHGSVEVRAIWPSESTAKLDYRK